MKKYLYHSKLHFTHTPGQGGVWNYHHAECPDGIIQGLVNIRESVGQECIDLANTKPPFLNDESAQNLIALEAGQLTHA